nr:hypothetical protein [Frigoriglobus tundricola]
MPRSALCITKPPGRPATHTCGPEAATHRKSQFARAAAGSPRFTYPHDFPPSLLVRTAPPSHAAKHHGCPFSLLFELHATP